MSGKGVYRLLTERVQADLITERHKLARLEELSRRDSAKKRGGPWVSRLNRKMAECRKKIAGQEGYLQQIERQTQHVL